MAKYNLMDNEKPEYFDRYFDEEDDKKKAPDIETEKSDDQSLPGMDDREYFDESLFTEETSPDQSIPDAPKDIQIEQPQPQEQIIAEEPIENTESIDKINEISQVPQTPPRPDISDYEYEDSKIQGINWKPLFIWGTVIIAIVAIVFFAYTLFFANGEEKVSDQKPTISPQEQMRIDQEKKKIAFIKNIMAEKTSRLNNFSSLSNLNISNVSYSSVLLYGNSFNFEVFGQSRDDIAKYNQNLKKNNYDNKFKIISVDTRPGSNGGLFALYKVESGNSGEISSQTDPKINGNIQNTVQDLIGKNGLKINTNRTINRKKVDQFEVIRNEIACSGTESNCLKFLEDLNILNNNFNVHKITLIPTNQKNIKTSKYNLLVVFDFYI